MRMDPSSSVHDPQRRPWFVDQRTLEGLACAVQILGGELAGAVHQLLVGRTAAPFLVLQPGHHLGHPLTFLSSREARGNGDDGPSTVAVCAHRRGATAAPAHLHGRQGVVGHGTTVACYRRDVGYNTPFKWKIFARRRSGLAW